MVTGVYPTKRGVSALLTFNLTSFPAHFTRDQVLLFPQFYLTLLKATIYIFTLPLCKTNFFTNLRQTQSSCVRHASTLLDRERSYDTFNQRIIDFQCV